MWEAELQTQSHRQNCLCPSSLKFPNENALYISPTSFWTSNAIAVNHFFSKIKIPNSILSVQRLIKIFPGYVPKIPITYYAVDEIWMKGFLVRQLHVYCSTAVTIGVDIYYMPLFVSKYKLLQAFISKSAIHNYLPINVLRGWCHTSPNKALVYKVKRSTLIQKNFCRKASCTQI